MGIDAFIPRHCIEKIGLIKGIPTDVDIHEIINKSISPYKILKAHRKVRTEESNKVEWVPSETVLITFESTTLPDYIKVFGLYNTKVHVYINPVKTCKNWYRYGHSTKFCKSTPVCAECGNKQNSKEHSCDKEILNTCLHYKQNHPTFVIECKHYQYNKKTNTTMAYECKGYWDAKNKVDKELIEELNLTPKENISSEATLNSSNFPHLKKLSMADEFKIKRFRGKQRENTQQNHQWPTTKSEHKITPQTKNTIDSKVKPIQQPSNSNISSTKDSSSRASKEDNTANVNNAKSTLKDKFSHT